MNGESEKVQGHIPFERRTDAGGEDETQTETEPAEQRVRKNTFPCHRLI